MNAAPARVPRYGTAHIRSAYVRQGQILSERAVARPVATADQQQAEYFMRLLTHNARHIDHRINDYQKAIAVSEASGDAESLRGIRRQSRAEEKDRQTVEGLIENLQRRFAVRASGEVPHLPRGARPVVR